MTIIFYLLSFIIFLLLIFFYNGFSEQLKIKNKFITDKDKKDFEIELFGENDTNHCSKSILDILNELDEDKLNELKIYYEKKEDCFENQHRDFINKANLYFQMYLISWGYIGALILFLLTGNNNKIFPLFQSPHFIICFILLIIFHLLFFLQVLFSLIFIPDYVTDKKNSVIKNISKPRVEYLRRIVQNKAYSYHCNNLLLKNIKKTLMYTPVKFILMLIPITILAVIIVIK